MTPFPADQFERDLNDLMDAGLLDGLDQAGYEFHWPRIRRGLERWIAAAEHSLDETAREQELEV